MKFGGGGGGLFFSTDPKCLWGGGGGGHGWYGIDVFPHVEMVDLADPWHEISNMVCATSKGSDQPYSMTVKLLTEHHLEFLSLKGDCKGSSESTFIKLPHCCKPHVTAHIFTYVSALTLIDFVMCVFWVPTTYVLVEK